MQLYQRAGMRLLENGLTMTGYGRKRRSLGEINKMVIFQENVLKGTSYLFKQRYIFGKTF